MTLMSDGSNSKVSPQVPSIINGKKHVLQNTSERKFHAPNFGV